MIALVVQSFRIVCHVGRVVNRQPELREPGLLQHGVSTVPAVAAHYVSVDHAEPGDRVAYLPNGGAVD